MSLIKVNENELHARQTLKRKLEQLYRCLNSAQSSAESAKLTAAFDYQVWEKVNDLVQEIDNLKVKTLNIQDSLEVSNEV
ncbi:hypothetical protein OsccyDRAFT_0579 [Leptolyngbyaceae cyanobacterium JSC-12]|nr:hypothetical protein OsccyDRAFT_0579 [Leptolyngbyaceae cyanobacterium JSC-12]